MTTLRTAARQVLEALKGYRRELGDQQPCDAEQALEAALAEPDDEPDDEPTYCPTCGEEDGGTTCGMPDCGLRCGAEPVQEPRTIRMERVDRSTSQHWWSEAARIRMPSPELYAAGDTVLCWVNEGDMVRAAQPKAEPVQEHDLSRCPKCNGPADNGHDREVPPNPYVCTKCMAEPVAWRWGYRSVTTGEMDWRGYVEIPAHPNLRSPEIIMEPLYAAPPQRKPLTEEEIFAIENDIPDDVISDRAWTICFARAVERAHGIGGEE